MEPLVRASLERLATSDVRLDGTAVVGGYWTRTGSVEVDLVGVAQWPGASRVGVVGSIKWRDRSPFDPRDLADLAAHRAEVPGGSGRCAGRGEPLQVYGARLGGGLRSRRPGVRLALIAGR